MNPEEPQNLEPNLNSQTNQPVVVPPQDAQQPTQTFQSVPQAPLPTQPQMAGPQPQGVPVMSQQIPQPPQPTYANSMPQINNVPNLNNAYLDKSAPGITFGVWSIITSLIPIIGITLGIVAVIKGFTGSHKNKVLGVLGIIGILLSITVAVLTFVLLAKIDKPAYGELTSKSGTLTGQYSDSGYYDYSFKYPEEDFEVTDVPIPNAVVYEDRSDVDEENSVSKIILVVEELEPDSVVYDEKVFETELGRQTIEKLISDTLGLDLESTSINTIDTEYSALFGNAILFEYTSTAPSGLKIQGSFVFVVNTVDGSGYNFFLGSSEDVWNENLDTFTEIRDSLNNK